MTDSLPSPMAGLTTPFGSSGQGGNTAPPVPAEPSTSFDNPDGRGDRLATIIATATINHTGSPDRAIDGNLGSTAAEAWYFNPEKVAGKEIKYEFLSGPRVISKIRWIQSVVAVQGMWKVQGSTDDNNWVDISSEFTLGSPQSQDVVLDLPSATFAYNYFRFFGVNGQTSFAPWLIETEFEINPA